MLINIKVLEKIMTLVNIYAPNNETKAFFNKLRQRIQTPATSSSGHGTQAIIQTHKSVNE